MSRITQAAKPSAEPRNEATMFPLIEAYLKGHIRRSAFCQQHNLSIDTFKYWQKKYKKAQKAKNPTATISSRPKSDLFVPLHLASTSPAEQTTCELIFPNGVRLHFPQPVTPQFLIQLIRAGE